MTKCRVFYRLDGKVSVFHPAPEARQIRFRPPHGKPDIVYSDTLDARALIPGAAGEGVTVIIETDQDFLDRVGLKAVQGTELEGLPFDDIDPATLPDRNDRDKWRGSKASGLRVDPSVVTLAERRKAVEDALDVEYDKPNLNVENTLRLQRQLNKGNF